MTSDSRNGGSTIKQFQSKCPLCGEMTLFSPTNPFRPFCSEGCRDRDFTAWASDSYHIAGKKLQEQEGDDADFKDKSSESEDENF